MIQKLFSREWNSNHWNDFFRETVFIFAETYKYFYSSFRFARNRRECVFLMVILPAIRIGQYRVHEHPYHAPQFIELWINFIQKCHNLIIPQRTVIFSHYLHNGPRIYCYWSKEDFISFEKQINSYTECIGGSHIRLYTLVLNGPH